MAKTQKHNLRSKTLRSHTNKESKKEINSSSNDIKKTKKTAFKASKRDIKKTSTSSLSNNIVSIESYVCSNVAKKVSSPTEHQKAQNLIVKESNNIPSNVCCICSKQEPKRLLYSCQICETKIHRDCLMTDEPGWKLKLNIYSWMCKQCRTKHCVKCYKTNLIKELKTYQCSTCKVCLHEKCLKTYVPPFLYKMESGLYTCTPCNFLVTQNAEKEDSKKPTKSGSLNPSTSHEDPVIKDEPSTSTSPAVHTEYERYRNPYKPSGNRYYSSSDEDDVMPEHFYRAMNYPYKNASDFIRRNFIGPTFFTPCTSPVDKALSDGDDADKDLVKSSPSTLSSDKNVEDKEPVKLGSMSPVSSCSDKYFIDLKSVKSGSISPSSLPSEKDFEVIEPTKSGSMDSSLQFNIDFKIEEPAKSDSEDSLPFVKSPITGGSTKSCSMDPCHSQSENDPVVIEPAKSHSMDPLPYGKVPVAEESSMACSMELFNPQSEEGPVVTEPPAKSNSINVLFSQSDKDPVIELAKSYSMNSLSSSSEKNPVVVEPGKSVSMSLSTSASDKDPVVTDLVQSDFMNPSTSQSDIDPIEGPSKPNSGSSLPPNKFLVVKDFAKSSFMFPSSSSPKRDVVDANINASSDLSSLSDADFENSSFDSEDFNESFKTHCPSTTFEQKEEIPDSMDWSVQQVHQYLSDRGLSKVATDKILENSIDGRALHLLSREDITGFMDLKIGPALKLYKEVRILQTRSMHTKVFYE